MSTKNKLLCRLFFVLKRSTRPNFLMLSHFDEDHINGVVELVKGKQVERLILPYFPLWQRLLIAFELGVSSKISGQLRFYLNPVEYLLEHCGEALSEGAIYLLPVTEEIDFPLELRFDDENKIKENKNEFQLQDSFQLIDNKVVLLPIGWAMSFYGVEFVPYNVPLFKLKKYPKNVDLFRQKVENLSSFNNISQKNIDGLKTYYDKEFVRVNKKGQKNSRDRNGISAFLYVGGINENFAFCSQVNKFRQFSLYEAMNTHSYFIRKDFNCIDSVKNGILYTGDGFLKKPAQFDDLKYALGDRRMDNIFCLQVAHHGSRHNWHKGLADKIKPCLSIFPANPNFANYRHPHNDVVKDFLPYSPTLVEQHSYVVNVIYT